MCDRAPPRPPPPPRDFRTLARRPLLLLLLRSPPNLNLRSPRINPSRSLSPQFLRISGAKLAAARARSSAERSGGGGGGDEPSDRERGRGESVEEAGGSAAPSSFDFLELKRGAETGEGGLVPSDSEGPRAKGGRRGMMRRSSLLAKQVISVRSARSLGFVSQLWVDTTLWVVALVEVRPNLLSGEIEKFLLEDIYQVGDVVLVQDESVIENELKMIGLDSLVGYNVVTSGRQNVGKVRGFTFNINSGAVESLELDSFGFSIIPASLVSTYSLFVEDILEVFNDTILVHDDAVSRVQRITKGIWDTQNKHGHGDQSGEYYRFRRRSGDKFRRMRNVDDDDWDLPMDY
ncbi:hypothetical protein ACMD2_12765 [Ananas comosus]|uniref:PRC-barrel domain-containing protein n=1 Tax=Ananas comosus TaxID=4615 RepID=A0A199UJX8_ANACO|nr:hypothetical protein ACMD2_12765 [Ananas comosus]